MVLRERQLMSKLVNVYMLSPKSECEVLALKLRGEHYLTESQKVYQPLVQSQSLSLKINFLYNFMRVYFLNCRVEGILPSSHEGAEENTTISLSFMLFCTGLCHLNWRKKTNSFLFGWGFFNNCKTLIDMLTPGKFIVQLLVASSGSYVICWELTAKISTCWTKR